MGELLICLTQYFVFYNGERPHQALENQTPDAVHQSAACGAAMILDKYRAVAGLPIPLRSTGTTLDEGRLEIPGNTESRKQKTAAAPSTCLWNRVQLN